MLIHYFRIKFGKQITSSSKYIVLLFSIAEINVKICNKMCFKLISSVRKRILPMKCKHKIKNFQVCLLSIQRISLFICPLIMLFVITMKIRRKNYHYNYIIVE